MKTGKKILSVALALVMALSMVAAGVTPAFALDHVYSINSYEDLKAFADIVNTTDVNASAVLMEDVFAADENWIPIGNSTQYFGGTFDGQGHTIYGLNFSDDWADYVGLFGTVARDGIVRNLSLDGSEFRGNSYVGLVGRNVGTIENCSNKSDFYASGRYTGGIAGENAGTIQNCYNAGSVSGETFVGGITGFVGNGKTVTNCYNVGDVLASDYSGAIAGLGIGSVTYCYYDSNGIQGAVNGADTDTARVLTTDQMKGTEALLYMIGFYFSDWTPRENDYPVLKWEEPTFDDDPDDPDAGLVWNGEDERYEISDYAGLRRFAAIVNGESSIAQDLSADAVLTADITAGSAKWTPIGRPSSAYKGTFDGNGHTVTGLTTVSDLASDYTGLFGSVGSNGTVCNLMLEGGRFSGSENVGIIGSNYGTVRNCSSSVAVIISDSNAGGIAGENYGTIEYCVYTGQLKAYVRAAGGIAGVNYGTITNCYNTGLIYSDYNVGGIAGQNYNNGNITKCYNTGLIGPDGSAGGIAGSNIGSVNNSYYDSDLSGVQGAVAGADTDTARGLTTAEMTGTGALLNMVGFSSVDWIVREDDYPVLNWQAQPEIVDPDNPDAGLVWNDTDERYEISDYAGLRRFAAMVNGESVIEQNLFADAVLTADITAGSGKWTPIGCASAAYKGTFDGNGHAIIGLTLAEDFASDHIGLFNYVGTQGTVCNLRLEGGAFTGNEYVALVGENYGTVRNCFTSASFTAESNYAGGIAGVNYGTIECCINTGSVTSVNNFAGGIAGSNVSEITNCYNTGDINADCYAGGITGIVNSGKTVKNCYNIGAVNAYIYEGAIAGSGNGIVNNCYYDTACGASGGVNGEDNGVTMGLTTAEMTGTEALMNLVGFSSAVWVAREDNYPELRWIAPSDYDDPDDPAAGLVWNEADNRYEISDYAGLRRFAAIVNGESSLEHNNFVNAILTADITAGTAAWTPIGNENDVYQGTFDGNGHTVTGLSTVSDLGSDYAGFFGSVGEYGTVRGLIVEGGRYSGNNYVGLAGINYGSIEYCSCSAAVISVGNYTGGITGLNYGSIYHCSFKGSVSASGTYTGGIAGNNYGTINCCINSGSIVSSGSYVGGITGRNINSVKSCCNTGFVSAEGDGAGGIAGVNMKLIQNCYNTGSIIASTSAGGIAGQNLSDNTSVTSCYNIGNISAEFYIGNIIGNGYENTLVDCYYDESASGVSGAACGEDTSTAKALDTEKMTSGSKIFISNDAIGQWKYIKGEYPVLVWQLDEIVFEAHSLTIEGDIAVNFYIDLGDFTEAAYAQFTVDGETVTVPVDITTFTTVGDKTLYKFACNVAPAQIDTPVTCVVYNGKIRSEEYTYSVNTYLDEIMADESLNSDELITALAGSIAMYGYASNQLFEYNPDFVINDISQNVSGRVSNVTAAYLNSFEDQMDNTADGVVYYGSSLVLRTKAALRLYFTLPSGSSVDDFIFTLGEGEDAAELIPSASGRRYYVEITDIPAPELGDTLDIYVTDGGGNVVNTWHTSAMSYARRALIKYEQNDPAISEALALTVKALTVYYEAASAYFEANTQAAGETNYYLFVDNAGFGSAILFAWDENGDPLCGDYPGNEITETVDYGNGGTAYKFTLPEGTAGFLITSWGGFETEEITDFDCAGYLVYGDKDSLGHYTTVKIYS